MDAWGAYVTRRQATARNTPFIREHGFMPTNTLYDSWSRWHHNIDRINAALERRTEFVRQGVHLPMNTCRKLHHKKNDALRMANILYTEDEQKLAKLFYYYVEACCKKMHIVVITGIT